LKYLSSDIVSAQVDALGIPVKKIMLDSNKNAIWVQGLPRELGKVRELIAILDKAENSSGQASALTLTPLETAYITAGQMNSVLTGMGIQTGIIIDANPKTLWIYGSKALITQVNEIKNKVDIVKNANANSITLTERNMSYMTAQEMISIFNELSIAVDTITFDRRLQTIWLTGDSETVKKASELIDTFDVYDKAISNVFFVYKFVNITAEEGERRFSFLEMENVKTYTLNFPEYSKSMMLFCPLDYKGTVLSNLSQLDIKAEKIKVPIDYSKQGNGASQLQARRDLIVNLSGIPAASFTISGNVSRDDKPHYIMYIEETPEVIQRIKDLIASIDMPLRVGNSN
jgi:hypothetical protein